MGRFGHEHHFRLNGSGMKHSKDLSPVGWYISTYQLRFVELADKRKNDLSRRFTVWENTVLVKASNPREAYRKVQRIATAATKPYKGGVDAIDVQWLFEGIVELLPVYEDIEDGAEIMWGERTRSLAKIRTLAKPLRVLQQSRTRPEIKSTRSRAKKRAPG